MTLFAEISLFAAVNKDVYQYQDLYFLLNFVGFISVDLSVFNAIWQK